MCCTYRFSSSLFTTIRSDRDTRVRQARLVLTVAHLDDRVERGDEMDNRMDRKKATGKARPDEELKRDPRGERRSMEGEAE